MAAISLTYTLTNGTTADASQVMQNFNDLVNGTSDGTKDFSINALTVAGTATLNGNVNLGNSSSDDLTVTASLASTIPVKTNTSYDIGSSTLGLRSIYVGGTSTFTTRIMSAATASWTLTLPVTNGVNRSFLVDDGTGATSWLSLNANVASGTSSDQTLTNTSDNFIVYTPSADHAVVLPTTGVLKGREFTIVNKTTRINSTRKLITIKAPNSGTPQSLTLGNSCNATAIFGFGYCKVIALQDTPTTAAHWYIAELQEQGNYGSAIGYSNVSSSSGATTGADTSLAGLHWVRNMNHVMVSGVVDITATADLIFQFNIDTPTTASFTSSRQAGGTWNGFDTVGSSATQQQNRGGICAVNSSSTVTFKGTSSTSSASGCACSFQYWIQT